MMCDYGCGQEAKHQFKNGKWCCSISQNSCPETRKKNSFSNTKYKKIKPIIKNGVIICSYGCGQEGKYQRKNGKWCCSSHWTCCPEVRKKISRTNTKEKVIDLIIENGIILCSYGCGKRGKHQLKNGKWCCGKSPSSCPKVKQKMKKAHKSGKQNRKWNGGYYSRNIPQYDIYAHQISYIEKVKRNKNDKNILEVTCTYCGKWFIPSRSSVYERIRALNGTNNGEQRLYCSDLCKQECSIFWQHKYPKDHKPATSREVQPELRQMRFKIDNYTCQKCNKHQDELEVALHCHHIEGIRWEPLESADLDKCITVCEDCHEKIHKIEGCGYHDMKCPDKYKTKGK